LLVQKYNLNADEKGGGSSPRSRYIVALGLAAGLGSAIAIPGDLPIGGSGPVGSSAKIILTTPYCIGTLAAFLLHCLLPYDPDEVP
jgi:hypothetical protein